MNPSRLLETDQFNQLAKGRDGYYLYNINDTYIGQAIAKYGEYGGLEAQFLGQFYGPGDVVIEIGANIGAHTIGIAKKAGVNGRVFAFEPQRLVFQNLCANIALNSLVNVECYWAAAGATHNPLVVPELNYSQPYNFGAVSLGETSVGYRIPCTMLDDFTSLPRLRLIKIDVEGMESEVIKGGKQLIAKFKPFLYVENDRVDKSEELMRLIDSLGYRMYWHIPPLFNPNNFYGVKENIYRNIASFNMYCIHRDTDFTAQGEEIVDFSRHPLQKTAV